MQVRSTTELAKQAATVITTAEAIIARAVREMGYTMVVLLLVVAGGSLFAAAGVRWSRARPPAKHVLVMLVICLVALSIAAVFGPSWTHIGAH